ncbi:hypothetical protein ACFRCI_44430 [Streptomyces sp. NPDC056638]|uniref:hypothetical protein n=1 Tax=Streptomyces sp. NPDC056638 TaxID=3345887 RepID=UPI0036AF6F4D
MRAEITECAVLTVVDNAVRAGRPDLARGVHRSVQPLERAIRSWLAGWNGHPRPFVWTKTADDILDKVAAYCRRISDSGH